jgi:hypothetical protein
MGQNAEADASDVGTLNETVVGDDRLRNLFPWGTGFHCRVSGGSIAFEGEADAFPTPPSEI